MREGGGAVASHHYIHGKETGIVTITSTKEQIGQVLDSPFVLLCNYVHRRSALDRNSAVGAAQSPR